MTGMEYGTFTIPAFCGFGLHLELDGFRLAYTLIAVLMWAVSGVFSGEYMAHYEKRSRYYLFFWLTFLATAGVFLSADLYTTFIFFEIMSFTSYVWVAFDEKKESLRAAETYLAVAVIGGMVMLMGLFLLYHQLGTLEMSQLCQAASEVKEKGLLYVAGGLLLFGFGAKAGCFPLHIWLPKAHPVAPAPASALLSGILTKTGIFGIIVVSCRIFGADRYWGLLIAVLGIITMFLGAFLALFSVNLKRTLACSSVSQIGFILVGIGMYGLLGAAGENPSMAARGAFLHMVNHSMFKLVLFLCAGAVYMNLHQLDLNDIRGFGRNKPVLKFCFLMGALGITGVPLWSGYVSKTLLHESIVEYQMLLMEMGEGTAAGLGMEAAGAAVMGAARRASGALNVLQAWIQSPGFWKAAEWIFLLSGGMTAAYMLKLFVAVFVEKHPDRQAEFDAMSGCDMKKSSAAVLLIPALLILIGGAAPSVVMDRLADLGQGFFLAEGMEHPVVYFSLVNLKGSLISLGIGLLIYFAGIRRFLMKENRYVDVWPKWLDLENMLYRPVLQTGLPNVCGAVCSLADRYLVPVTVKVFLAVSAAGCRLMDSLADGLIRLARATTHRQLREPVFRREEDRAAQTLGRFLDGWNLAWFRLKGGKRSGREKPASRIPALMQKEEIFLRVGQLVEESFSFGLLLFTAGLCLTLGYLLAVFFRM
ncbi:MAG: complex I subunit 5 family protein [Lachnospiraceae bacterium]|nr:complex I subunit 5 family protein [Lachnospiraceae bacterium]